MSEKNPKEYFALTYIYFAKDKGKNQWLLLKCCFTNTFTWINNNFSIINSDFII